MTKVHLQEKMVARQHGGDWYYKRSELEITAFRTTLTGHETGQLLSALADQQKSYRHSGSTGDAVEMNKKLISKLMKHGDAIYASYNAITR